MYICLYVYECIYVYINPIDNVSLCIGIECIYRTYRYRDIEMYSRECTYYFVLFFVALFFGEMK